MPVWVPPVGESAGFAEVNIKRALDKGLTFRPLSDTTRATLEWFKKQSAERQAKLRAGIKPEREKEVLAAWHAGKK
jgi:2'-hydroxyisoflavone reductase